MSMKNKRLILIKYKAKEFQQIYNRKKRFPKNFHAGTATNFMSKVKRHKNLTFSSEAPHHLKTPNHFVVKSVSRNIKTQIVKNALSRNVK